MSACASKYEEAPIITQNPDVQIVPHLSSSETKEKEECEEIIRSHLRSFLQCASALKRIHDKKLYRADFSTFEAYSWEQWGYGRAYAHRLVKAADYVENILRPLGDGPLPENESQIRPLTSLPPEKAMKAWKEVTKKAKASKLTASLVVEVVARFADLGPSRPSPSLSSIQKEIQKLISLALDAVEEDDFEGALKHIRAAQIRIEVEANKINRTSSE